MLKNNEHPIYGKTYMKRSNNIFSVFKVSKEEWWLYLQKLEEDAVRYLGKLSKGCIVPVEECNDFYARHYSREFYEKILREYKHEQDSNDIEIMVEKYYNEPMKNTGIEKKDRNRKIYKLVGEGWSYTQIMKRFGFKSKATISVIVNREKNREETKVKLSTGKQLTVRR